MSRFITFITRPRIAITFGISTGLYLNQKRLYCSPTFQGVPVAGTLLIHQSLALFDKQFPGLEVAGAYVPGELNHSYTESMILGIYPTECKVTIPVYERLSKQEEERLGRAMLKKIAVGVLVLEGDCKVGCAASVLKSASLYRIRDNAPDYDALVWQWVRTT